MIRDYNVYARLAVNGEAVPIHNFRLEAPADQVGMRLTADLSDPLQADPEDGAEVLFEIGIDSGTGIEWVVMMDVARVKSISGNTGWKNDPRGGGPSDSVSIQALSKIAEKWDLCPEAPLVLYDPHVISPVTESVAGLYDLLDENYRYILPRYISIPGFDLIHLLRYVYVDQLGFSRIVTNIGTFFLPSIAVGVTDSLHSIVMREIGVFDPFYHADDSGVLWILDPRGTPPVGMSGRSMTLRNYANFHRSKKTGRLATSAILSYRAQSTGSVGVPRNETKTIEVGTFGQEGWQRTVETKFILDFKDDPSRPFSVTRSVVTRIRTETTAVADGLPRLTGVSDQEDHYLYDYRLKVGYTNQVSSYCKIPGESAKMRAVQTERSQVEYRQLTSQPTELQKVSEIKDVSGLVLAFREDSSNPLLVTRRQSVFKANKFDQIPEDDAGVTVEVDRPIMTQIDTFRVVGNDQIEVDVQRVDHLRKTAPVEPETFQHTGTIQVSLGPQVATVNMLIHAPDWTPGLQRTPLKFSAGNLPVFIARSLADRALLVQSQTPTSVTADLAGLDLAMMRGSTRIIVDRRGNEYNTFVTGFNVDGRNLGTPDFSVSMDMTGTVVP